MEQTRTSRVKESEVRQGQATKEILTCAVCGHSGPAVEETVVRCNVRRFRDKKFGVWRCGECGSLHSEKVENLTDYYRDYPIRQAKLDYFLRVWYGVLLKRLVEAGLKKEHSILDYGCNHGLFLDFLKEKGYRHSSGFDPYVERFQVSQVLERKYDWVISMDVIEHDEDPQGLIHLLGNLRNATGRLCLTTPNGGGIDLTDPERHLHQLHVPYHVHILSLRGLVDLCRKEQLNPVAVFTNWYMDSWQPGTSQTLIETLMGFGGNDVDLGYEPPRIDLFFKHPSLIWKLFFGYFQQPKKKDHMMVIFSNTPTMPN